MPRLTLSCLLCLSLHACSGGEPARSRDLQVLSFEPVVDDAAELTPLRLRFDRPVVSERDVGKPLARAPLRVQPALGVSAHWEDRQTLAVRPLQSLRGGTRYRVTLAPELARRIASPSKTEFSFVHRPLRVEGLEGIDTLWAPPEPEFSLRFNQPVSAQEVTDRCVLRDARGRVRVALRSAQSDRIDATIVVAAAAKLEQGAQYGLECEGLKAHGGDAPLGNPLVGQLQVYPRAALVRIEPASAVVTPDGLQLRLAFATPVPLDELQRRVRITPAVSGFAQAWYARESGAYEAVVNLEAQTSYRIDVDAKLTDGFGQQLGQSHRVEFKTSDASPSMQLETGIYAIEAAAPGYAVFTRNVDAFEIDCAYVPRRKISSLLTSDMNYDAWTDAGVPQDEAIDWTSIGLSKRTHRIVPASSKNKWTLSTLALGSLCGASKRRAADARGLYLVELRSDAVAAERLSRGYGRYPFRVLGNVTDLGVLLKLGPASGLTWVTRISDGTPVAGASVSLYTPEGKRVYQGETDRDGLLRTPGSTTLLRRKSSEVDEYEGESWDDIERVQRVIAVVEKDGDLAAVDGTWQDGLQIWNFGLQSDRSPARTRVRGFIQSDRGIYRPGEQVHFKGLLREIALGASPRVPGSKRVAVHVEDARGASLLDKQLPLSSFGSFAFDLGLGADATLGDYYVTASVQGQQFRERFQVEEFRPVAFEVSANGAPQHVRAGERVGLAFEASYLFGAKVARAEVEWEVQRRPHALHFTGMDEYTFYDSGRDEDYYGYYDRYDESLSFVSEGSTKTDAQGRFTVVLKDKQQAAEPQDYLIRASVTDQSKQSVSKQVVLTAHSRALYLGLHSQEWVQAVDMPFAIHAVAVAPDGTRVATQARLALTRRSWSCRQVGAYRFESRCERHEREQWSRPVAIASSAPAVEAFSVKEPGEYVIALSADDGRGQRVRASTTVWVIGKGEAFWSGDESARMSLIANKTSYEPGERAKLVPRADTTGAHLLVTLERDGIVDAFVVQSEGSGSGIEVPLSAAHAPNVYASVAMVRGRRGPGDALRPEFKLGVIDLPVSAERQRLQVAIETERAQYEPGERVRGKIKVRSGQTPVRAELSLSVADEGVLSLISYKTPDPMQAFYAPFGLGVDSATNWNRVARPIDPALAEEDEGGGDAGGEAGLRVRARFLASALWIPSLLTDEHGEAEFSFDAPDNLTAFRLMAVAADIGARFGSGEQRIRVAKSLLATPVLPRFAQSGDLVRLGAVIHNYTGHAGEAQVKLAGKGFWTREPARSVALAAGASTAVLFPVRIGERAQVEAQLSVALGSDSDAFVQRFPVRRPVLEESEIVAQGQLSGERSHAIDWPRTGLQPGSELVLSLDQTGLSRLGPALRYLVRYPYGCLEQTLSGLLPLISVKELNDSVELAEIEGRSLDRLVRAGVDKVLRHQHADGHFGLWPDSRAYPHLTAYALFGLTQARAAGVVVNRDAFARGLDALRDFANGEGRTLAPGGEVATIAMAAYVLAANDRADPGLQARLLAARNALPLYGKAFLLRALLASRANRADAAALVQALLAELDTTWNATWPQHERAFYMSSPARDQAIALWALLAFDPAHPRIESLLASIEQARLSEGRWGNTQENLYALLALADYARLHERQTLTVGARLSGKPLLHKTLHGSALARISSPLAALTPGELRLTSSLPAYYSVRRTLVRREPRPEPLARGFRVERAYFDAQSGAPLARARLGQLVRVRLTVHADEDTHYVAVDDPIPAGCEIVNTALATEGQSRWNAANDWVFDHQALHDDRANAFADAMPAGQHRFEYLMRPTLAGSYAVPPVVVEAMYEPARMARSAALTFEVTP